MNKLQWLCCLHKCPQIYTRCSRCSSAIVAANRFPESLLGRDKTFSLGNIARKRNFTSICWRRTFSSRAFRTLSKSDIAWVRAHLIGLNDSLRCYEANPKESAIIKFTGAWLECPSPPPPTLQSTSNATSGTWCVDGWDSRGSGQDGNLRFLGRRWYVAWAETLALSRAVLILKELTTVEFWALKKRSASEKNGPRGEVVV